MNAPNPPQDVAEELGIERLDRRSIILRIGLLLALFPPVLPIWIAASPTIRTPTAILTVLVMAVMLLTARRRPQLMTVAAIALSLAVLGFWTVDAATDARESWLGFAGLQSVPLMAAMLGGRRLGWFGGLAAGVAMVGLWWFDLPAPSGEPATWVDLTFRVLVLLSLLAVMEVVSTRQGLLARLLDHTVLTEQLLAERAEDLGEGLDLAQAGAGMGRELAQVAHDLSNPLTYAASSLELALESEEDRRVLIEEALDGLRRTASVVSLLHAREETPEPLLLTEVAQAALRQTRSLITRQARLEVSLDEHVVVAGVEDRLVQVVGNLLTNAAQALEGRDHVVRVDVHHEGDDALLIVEDSGVGIDPSIADRITEPFFTTKADRKGMGLGLAICVRHIQDAGGSLTFSPGAERGTRVTVRLPRYRQPITTEQAQVPWYAAPTSLTALVIDDEPAVLEVLRRGLRPLDVKAITDGRQALQLCRDHHVDVILCDLMMPNLSGPEVYRQVTETMPELAPRFLFVTGGAFSPEAKEFLASRRHRVLDKPMALGELRARVREIIEQSSARELA